MLWLHSPVSSGTSQRWRKGHGLASATQKLALVDIIFRMEYHRPMYLTSFTLPLLRNKRLSVNSGLWVMLSGEIATSWWQGDSGNGQHLPLPKGTSTARQPGPSLRNWWAPTTRARKEISSYPRSSMDFQQRYYFYLFNVVILSGPRTAQSYEEGNKLGRNNWVKISVVLLIAQLLNPGRRWVWIHCHTDWYSGKWGKTSARPRPPLSACMITPF